ncbi:hypothetical protein KAR91_13935 [Candidatus Pacearchaeota archaeon]|nr:hypothetical protein [Candidatus Pacearchaeota archaeon]
MSLEMKYFVLKPRAKTPTDLYAYASQKAMLTYAELIECEDEDLAKSLREWAYKEMELAGGIV